VSYTAVIIALLLMRLPRVHKEPTEPMRPVREFVETLAYVRVRPGIITAIATVTLIGFFGITMQVLSVVMAEEVFDRGGGGFGVMVSMIGLGAVLATPVVASMAGRVKRSRIEEGSLLLYGVGVMLLGLAPTFELALLGLVIMGAAHIASASTLNTAIQLQVDEDVRAKVLSVYLTTLLLANPIGQLVLGKLIEVIGPRETIGGAGAVLLTMAVLLKVTGRLSGLDVEIGTYEPAASAEVHPTTPAPPRRSPTARPAVGD
jgi:MFS family permease